MKESRGIIPLRTILQNCVNHIENLETNRSITDNYDKEFQDLKQFSETLKTQKEYLCTEGEKEVNRKKNRYKDILPFNISRVVLSEYAGIPGSDYINANYIKGASGSPAYIASQGPLPNTVNDFWRMVVECEVQVIVMACNAQESGKHKCENYWVEKEGEEKRFGMVQICLVKASTVCPDFLVRTMRLKYTNDKDVTEERTVCQFHYSAWPDHGVPPLVRPLLDMVRLVRDTQASETLPVLVHCSAGCGRTGTICAIDFVWGLLRAGKLTEEFSLFNLVKDMRKQRVAMVQTKEQYILVHQAVRELFKEQLRVIESHPYENIDFNGVPLIKDFEEPFYDTISIEKEDNCDEKQDISEMKNKGEDLDSVTNKMDLAPPLPRKKRPNVLFSKQEKEAENLTEKNRSSFAEKEKEREKEKTDASLSSLLGKPRIVRLRALFEKTPTAKERTLKERGSQTVSRSHSLGAIRKPISGEVFDPQTDKPKPLSPTSQPASDVVKLKHSKSFSRSVPLIKRSKSLKTFNQSSHLSLSATNPVILKNYQQKPYDGETPTAENVFKKPSTTCFVSQTSELAKEYSKRRRSLESLIGDVPPSATWRGVIEHSGIDPKNKQKSLDWSPKANTATGTKTADILKHQLQRLSIETEKKINTFVSGIGIRERRNSFRQAVTKSDFQNKKPLSKSAPGHREVTHQKSIDQPDSSVCESKSKNAYDSRKYRTQEKPSDGMKKVNRHLQQNQAPADLRTPISILSSKNRIEEPESKNLFLKKLNSEIFESHREGPNHHTTESRSRTGHEDSDKTSRYNLVLVRSDSKKTLFRTNIAIKPPGSYTIHSDTEVEGRLPEPESEKLYQPSARPNSTPHHGQKPPQTNECYKCSVMSASTSYTRPALPYKSLSYQNSSGEADARHKEQFFPGHKKTSAVVPAKVNENEVTISSYRKNPTSNSDLYVKTIGSEFEGSEKRAGIMAKMKSSKTYEHIPWSHPGPSRSSGEVSSSEHSSDSSKVCQFETENPGKVEVKIMKKPELIRTRVGNSEQQSVAQKKTEDTKGNSSVEFCNYGDVGPSKSRQNFSEYSKDDFLLKEPTAPPRVKRHASVAVPRITINGSNHVSRWIVTENKVPGVRNAAPFQADKNAWNGTIGVDLDAVAASMQQDKKELSTILKDGVWSSKNSNSATSSSPVKKKQHYL